MGYYIPNNIPINQYDNVEMIPEPTSLVDVKKDEAIICEVDNGMFVANGFAYSQSELEVFIGTDNNGDNRLRRWFKMPLKQAKELSGFN